VLLACTVHAYAQHEDLDRCGTRAEQYRKGTYNGRLQAGIFAETPSPQPDDELAVVSQKDGGGSCSQTISPASAPLYPRSTKKFDPVRHQTLIWRQEGKNRSIPAREQRPGWRESSDGVMASAWGSSSSPTADERTLPVVARHHRPAGLERERERRRGGAANPVRYPATRTAACSMGDLTTSLAPRGHSPGCRGRRTCGEPARTRPSELTCRVLAPRRGTWSPASRAALRHESRCVLLRHGLLQPRYRPARFFFCVWSS
jgi:hypothetical protein